MATYTAKTRNIGHRPRSKRLRELGGSVSIIGGGTSESGGSYAPLIHSHEMEDVAGLEAAMAGFLQQLGEKASTSYVTGQIANISGALQAFQLIRNLVTAISSESTDDQYPSAKLLYDQLAALANVYAAIRHTHRISDLSNLTALFTQFALNNGTVSLTIGGQQRSIELPTSPTPSGDPMHYLYEAIGCTYNTQTGLWTYRDFDDLTNEDVRNAYCFTFSDRDLTSRTYLYYDRRGGYPETNIRFNIAPRLNFGAESTPTIGLTRFCYGNTHIERLYLSYTDGKTIKVPAGLQYCMNGCTSLISINVVIAVGTLYVEDGVNHNSFNNLPLLKTLKISGLKNSGTVWFHRNPMFSLETISYMIVNAANTAALTIMLHADAYARAQADTTEYTYNGNTYTGCLALASAKNITVAS